MRTTADATSDGSIRTNSTGLIKSSCRFAGSRSPLGVKRMLRVTIISTPLGEVLKNLRGNHLRLRFLVPCDEQPQGGLTIYGYTAGRYPLGPTGSSISSCDYA